MGYFVGKVRGLWSIAGQGKWKLVFTGDWCGSGSGLSTLIERTATMSGTWILAADCLSGGLQGGVNARDDGIIWRWVYLREG